MTELNPSAADFISAPPGSEPEEEKTTSGSKTYQNERSLNADFDWKSKFRTDMVSQVEKWAAATPRSPAHTPHGNEVTIDPTQFITTPR